MNAMDKGNFSMIAMPLANGLHDRINNLFPGRNSGTLMVYGLETSRAMLPGFRHHLCHRKLAPALQLPILPESRYFFVY
jgi:hypothetical protein